MAGISYHRECQGCGNSYRVTKAGLTPKHGSCQGGGRAPAPATDLLEERLRRALDEFDAMSAEEMRRNLYRGYAGRAVSLIEKFVEYKIDAADVLEGDAIRAEFDALKGVLAGLAKLLYLADNERRYARCRVCGKRVTADLEEQAKRKYTSPVCSNECYHIEIFKRHGCCEKGKPIPCVCMHSWECPEHGKFHIGTHD